MQLYGRGRSLLLGGLCVAALGASLFAARHFHQAHERAEREIAAVRGAAEGQARAAAERSAQDRALAERLGRELAHASAERDRAFSALEAQGRIVAGQQRHFERLTAEHETVVAEAMAQRARLVAERDAAVEAAAVDSARLIAEHVAAVADAMAEHVRLTGEHESAVGSALAERARLTAERDAAVAGAAIDSARLVAEREAAVERVASEQARLLVDHEAALEEAATARAQLAQERDRAMAERDATMSETRRALRALDADTRNTVADVERIIVSTGLEPGRLVPEPNRLRRVGARGGPYVPWKAQVALAEQAEGAQLHALAVQLERLKALRDVMVRLPLIAPVTHAILSDGFGYRHDPINGGGARHDGLDLRAVRNSAILAPAAGTVLSAGWDGAFGNLIVIDHGFGVVSRYAHLSRMLVRKGDVVAPREQIGVVGATGRVTGTHLHYEIWIDGRPRDPMRFLEAIRIDTNRFAGFGRQ